MQALRTTYFARTLDASHSPAVTEPHTSVWNKVSTDCVHATSVNVFKNIIYKYLVKAGYT